MSSPNSQSKKIWWVAELAVGDVINVDSTSSGGWVEATVMELSPEAIRVHYEGVIDGKPVTLQKCLGYESDRYEIPKNQFQYDRVMDGKAVTSQKSLGRESNHLEIPKNSRSMAYTDRVEHDPANPFSGCFGGGQTGPRPNRLDATGGRAPSTESRNAYYRQSPTDEQARGDTLNYYYGNNGAPHPLQQGR